MTKTNRQWNGPVQRVTIPRMRDAFINAPLLSLGPDAKGVESFWISSANMNVGCLGVRISEEGDCRVYPFHKPEFGGFYSCAREDQRHLWLCGQLDQLLRFNLDTRRLEKFATGAPKANVFAGMVLDRETGKVFAAGFPPPEIKGFVFDTRARKPVKIINGFSPDHYMRFSFPNKDGTHTIVFQSPGVTFVKWNPRDDSLRPFRLNDAIVLAQDGPFTYRMIADEQGRWYVPFRGWFDPLTQTFAASGPAPKKEAAWFGRSGNRAYGCAGEYDDDTFVEWNMADGSVRPLCKIPEGSYLNTRLSRSGKLICVSVSGMFYRVDALTGALECSRRLPTDSVGRVDCLVRIDRERLLGTPFITQRFWEVNIRTGRGFDCGKAAPGHGEVLRVWKIRKKVYMAAYAGGELVEYDPGRHPGFPENPRVVARPPNGMRPNAHADDGRRIFYSCNAPYGYCGSVLTKYDTVSGLACYKDNPLPGLSIRSLFYDRPTRTLLGGTTIHADCRSATPVRDSACLARIDPVDLAVQVSFTAPQGVEALNILGPLGRGQWLCQAEGAVGHGGEGMLFFVLRDENFKTPSWGDIEPLPEISRTHRSVMYAGYPGIYICMVEGRAGIWDLRRRQLRQWLWPKDPAIYRVVIQADTVYLLTRRKVIILEGCLKGCLKS